MASARLAVFFSVGLLSVVGCCRPVLGTREGHSADAMAAHVRSREASYGRGFTVLAIPPFVVIGDDMPDVVRRESLNVVIPGVQKLKALYFERDPQGIIDLFMLRDTSSYEREAGTILGPPSTPYGFYAPCTDTIYVNMEHGSGTLVHEMLHAFMRANFPECPTWLNEGMGSLYEQPDLGGEVLRGLPNWRLPALKEAISRGETMPIEEMMSYDMGDFYADKRRVLCYAMARYLCYYLQEKGLLQVYYRRFVADHEKDPAGVETLKSVLEQPDLKEIQRAWEAATLAIEYSEQASQ